VVIQVFTLWQQAVPDPWTHGRALRWSRCRSRRANSQVHRWAVTRTSDRPSARTTRLGRRSRAGAGLGPSRPARAQRRVRSARLLV